MDKIKTEPIDEADTTAVIPAAQTPAALSLEQLRDMLNELDQEILERAVRRWSLAEAIYQAKQAQGGSIQDMLQEQRKIDELTDKLEPRQADCRFMARSLLQTLMRTERSLQYQSALRHNPDWEPGGLIRRAANRLPEYKVVACQGSFGSYTSQAAAVLFPEATALPVHTFAETCRQVVDDNVPVAVLPLENSTAGTVGDVYHLLDQYKLYIIASNTQSIHHMLLAPEGSSLTKIRRVVSHPQALAQCSTIIKGMGWETEESGNTAFAAEHVALLNDPTVAAIASADAAAAYGLAVISNEITNNKDNQTRFIAVSRQPVITKDANRIALILSLPHQSGSLARLLNLFGEADLNLTKIQSLPVPQRPWEYRFYLDIAAPARDPQALAVLYQLSQEVPDLKFLGWFQES
ncbi:MAG: prephenate dehydratase domain-containing protein [Oscillospiraceae bacterium]|nr:prephenate dehydratase domain-containing protein [Oscillospiraceae bacterium]MDD4369009.1 prephenate dehydratase domain-containing protein [Oscillospiraceae bacterium]